MWTHKDSMNSTPRGFPFSTPQPEKKRSYSSNAYSSPPCQNRPSPLPERKYTPSQSNNSNLFHVIHKVPAGDSPYVRAKHVQLVDNNPSKAVSLFWAAINSGDRVDSALKDMAVVMKQLNRSDEAIEAIKSFRHLCPHDAQDSLDNILLELYKRLGRIDEQIVLLQLKLKRIEEATSIDGNRTKLARSQGKKIQITIGQEYSRLLGNLAWAHLQQDNYKLAEEIYRKALSLDQDKNKRCNLAICLMYMGNMTEAKFLLSTVKVSNRNRDAEEESYAKSYDRAIQVMNELEMEKKSHTSNPLSFSLFLSRNKETDSAEISTKGKRSDSDPGFKRPYASPCTVSGTPQVPFTQPRRRDWVRPESGAGCLRKLHFEKAAEIKSEIPVMPLMEPQSQSKVVTDAGNKKSWADMVEEDEQNMLSDNKCYNSNDEYGNVNDEQILLESSSCYGDENEDCNIMNGKFNTLGVRDGYQSQPGTATCRRSQMVKRSLTFERSQSVNEDENYWHSSPVQKENMGYESSDCANGRF
ncbi:protein POLLENLESS 3-like [Rutidosis leptorrhynchoides]|uniref:protein POLLENLESS 3-like n=1 Tax=Rutidosis leptorrhynchoides TaxID=125765 RepID=UPI003A99AB04